MFYLKYRPRKISEIDNLEIRRRLTTLLQSKNIPHALLFIGQKGTGKTSTARILAKVVNCKNQPLAVISNSIEPCNQCKTCLSIDRTIFPDVLEIDAASHRGIEEIKNLIKEATFMPMAGRSRVFIIDEAHMITRDGFNALLKTLEEPPSSTVFILATTDPEKIPDTIRSRCFTINFSKAKKEDIIHMLQRIAKAEKINLKDDLLQLIASSSDHSFRDAAKILQELVTHSKLSFKEAQGYLGIKGKETFLEILDKKGVSQALAWIEKFYQTGGDIKLLTVDLMENLREALLTKVGVKTNSDINLNFSLQEINLLLKLLHQAYSNFKNSPLEIIPLEVAVVEFYNKRNLK